MLRIFLLLLISGFLHTASSKRDSTVGFGAPDPLQNVRLLADCLYNHNDLTVNCIPAYCQPSVTVHVRSFTAID